MIRSDLEEFWRFPDFQETTAQLPSNTRSVPNAEEKSKFAQPEPKAVALIFLLFVSFNGGFNNLNETEPIRSYASRRRSSFRGESRSASSPRKTWASASAQFDAVEIWSYENPTRSTVVRGDTVISVQEA